MSNLEQELDTLNNTKVNDSITDALTSFADSVINLKAEVERLKSVRSLALIHLNQYKQDYELLQMAYKSSLDWVQRNKAVEQQNFQQVPPMAPMQRVPFSTPNLMPAGMMNALPEQMEMLQPKMAIPQPKLSLPPSNMVVSTLPEPPQKDNSNLNYTILPKNPNVKVQCTIKACFCTKGIITTLDMTKDCKYIAFSDGNTVDVVNTVTSASLPSFVLPKKTQVNTRVVRFSQEGQVIAASYNGSDIAVFRVNNCDLLRTFKVHTKDVCDIVFTKDGKTMISAGYDGVINFWNYPSFELIKTLTNKQEGKVFIISGIAESIDGRFLYVSYIDGNISIVDLITKSFITNYNTHIPLILNIGISGFDGVIATCSNPNTTIWRIDSESMKTVKTLVGHTDKVLKIAFSSTKTVAVTGSKDERIIVWDYALEQPELFEIVTEMNTVFDICHSPVSNKFASCSAGGYICLWEYNIE